MKPRAGSLMATVLILAHLGFGKELKPDRVISITSLEHQEGSAPSKSYKVEAKTSGSEPTLYYKLACGTGAAYLEVGSLYKAAEAYDNDGAKVLVIFSVKPEADPKETVGIGCDVQSVKTADGPKR